MKKKTALLLAIALLLPAVVLGRTLPAEAFQSAVEAQGDEPISVLVGESVTLMPYAANMERDSYEVVSGAKLVTVNANGTFSFTGAGTVRIRDTVFDIENNEVARYEWTFSVVRSVPVAVTFPESVTVYSGNTATFSVETRQDEENVEYRWICTDPSGMYFDAANFPHASGWDQRVLVIEECKYWMSGYSFYCILSNSSGKSYTATTKAPRYAKLTVLRHPVASLLSVTDLPLPAAGVEVEYTASLDTPDCLLDSIVYLVDGEARQNYVPEEGDEVGVRITVVPAEERYFTDEEYSMVWNGFLNEKVTKEGTKLIFDFAYTVPENELSFEDSIPEHEESSQESDEESEGGHTLDPIERESLLRVILGGLILAAVIYPVLRVIVLKGMEEHGRSFSFRKKKKDAGEANEENE